MRKLLSICIVVVSFFAVSVFVPRAYAETFVSVDSQATSHQGVFHSQACVSVNGQTNCYNDVGSLQVHTIDDSINIGLENFFIYE